MRACMLVLRRLRTISFFRKYENNRGRKCVRVRVCVFESSERQEEEEALGNCNRILYYRALNAIIDFAFYLYEKSLSLSVSFYFTLRAEVVAFNVKNVRYKYRSKTLESHHFQYIQRLIAPTMWLPVSFFGLRHSLVETL